MKKLCSLLMILLLLTSMSASAQTIRDVVYEGVRYVFGIGERVEEVIPQLPDASGAQEQIAALEAERDALKVQLAKTEQELATAQTALTETEALLASTQTALTATEEALLSTEANLGETQAALAAAEANIADLSMQLEAETTCPPDIAALEAERDALKDQLARMEQELATTITVLAETQTKLVNTEMTLADTQVTLANAEDALTVANADLAAAAEAKAAADASIATLTSQLADTEARLAEAEAQLAATQEALAAATAPAAEEPQAAVSTHRVSAPGFAGGDVTVTVTLNDDGTITAMELDLSTQVSPICDLVLEEDFLNQFIGRKGPFIRGENVDIVTGATYTSGAVIDALNKLWPEEESRTYTASRRGFSSDVTVTVVITGDMVTSVMVDVSQETPRMGTRCGDADFLFQFVGQSGPFVLGQNVDVVSGATITSTAVVDAINDALAQND